MSSSVGWQRWVAEMRRLVPTAARLDCCVQPPAIAVAGLLLLNYYKSVIYTLALTAQQDVADVPEHHLAVHNGGAQHRHPVVLCINQGG